MTDPDPRTAPDDGEDALSADATNRGQSAKDPAEGADNIVPEQPGSPKG